ncbi:cartilage acidic protein 1-like protein, partial [Lates japonicus]
MESCDIGQWHPERPTFYLQGSDSKFQGVIAADFDNDRELEVFFNNIAYRGDSPNRLFRVSRRADADPLIQELNVGDAAEPQGRGT